MIFYIVFCDGKSREVFSGGTYIFKGERYACFDSKSPKLYKSEKTARKSAERLVKSCANTGDDYEIKVL